jgi:hypothetical protein
MHGIFYRGFSFLKIRWSCKYFAASFHGVFAALLDETKKGN